MICSTSRPGLSFVFLTSFSCSVFGFSGSDTLIQCENATLTPELQIQACSEIIEAENVEVEERGYSIDLANAYFHRAGAYERRALDKNTLKVVSWADKRHAREEYRLSRVQEQRVAEHLGLPPAESLIPFSLLRVAEISRELGEYATALAALNEAVDIAPERVEVIEARGLLKAELGDKEGSRIDCAQALRLNPSDFEIFDSHGLCSSVLGR